MFQHRTVTWLAVALCTGLLAPSARAQPGGIFEEAPTVHLTGVLPSALIRSPHHRVQDEVGIRGHVLEFRIDSDHGSYRVESVAMVALRVHEIGTLAQAIDHFQRANEQLATELRGVMRVGADSWVDILTSPLKTASCKVTIAPM